MTGILRVTAACAAAVMLAAAPMVARAAEDAGAVHLYRTPQQWQKFGAVPDARSAGSEEYFGGSVFSNVRVVSVIWGANVNAQTVSGMPGFLGALVNSTYVDQLSIYDTNLSGVAHAGTNQTIARGTFYGQIQITPQHKATSLSDSMIRAELVHQIGIGVLPANDLNTLYMVYFPKNVTITVGKSVGCSSFGAYHGSTSTTVTSTNIFYGVMPDCGYSFNQHTEISSHEFAEAMTDNIPTPGSHPKYPQAWNTSNGYEIGDLCESKQGTLTAGTTTYTVQEVYLNTLAGCGTANFSSP